TMKPRPRPVRREEHVFRDARTVEDQRVGAAVALNDVAAIAGIPREAVSAGAQVGDVVAFVAIDRVRAAAAVEHLGAVAAVHGVATAAAVDGERLLGEGAVDLVDAELIVTGAQEHIDAAEGGPIET